ncbi:hypothetical protein NT6N_04390 [Oceaniferula spumae]|uniref:Uncharacterized protein n=1 Tax=Oceaniferula spumae TaxID=2979115 RepID=A0AAT9FHH3_9BACT
MRNAFLFATLAMFVSCTGCSKKKQDPPPPVVVNAPDYQPIGEGMKVQSYALVGVAVIITVGLIARNGNH